MALEVMTVVGGMVGSLVTVYLARNTPIPAFRPFMDVDQVVKERDRAVRRRDQAQRDLDEAQAQMTIQQTDMPAKVVSLQKELTSEQTAVRRAHRSLQRHEILTRTLGFGFYVILGGFIGAALTGVIVVGDGNVPDFLQAVALGSAWPAYLSAIGFKMNQAEVANHLKQQLEEKAKQGQEQILAKVEEIEQKVSKATNPPKDLVSMISRAREEASVAMSENMMEQRVLVDAKMREALLR